jgi:hypothetical protein
MDDWKWMWMYQSWIQDQEEMHKTYKNYALFMGSFSNWEMANRVSKQDNPDHEASDEDFEKASEFVSNYNVDQPKHRRARRIIEDG